MIIRVDPDPILRNVCLPLNFIDDNVRKLCLDMLEMLDPKHPELGVGLAAPQVGWLRRIFVVKGFGISGAFINPEIVKTSGVQAGLENCLSLPGKSFRITRPDIVKMKYMDIDGYPRTIKMHDAAARLLCHEYDHLDGIMIDMNKGEVPRRP